MTFDEFATTFRALDPPAGSACQVMAVDGFSGAGKSVFAECVARSLDAPVFHMDDVVPGWDALAASIPVVRKHLLAPLAKGETARWRRFDWDALTHMEEHTLARCSALVLDGCGAGARMLAPYLTQIIWIHAPEDVCEQRVRERDNWRQYAPYRAGWLRQERALQAAEGTDRRAQVRVDNERSEQLIDVKGEFIVCADA